MSIRHSKKICKKKNYKKESVGGVKEVVEKQRMKAYKYGDKTNGG